SSGFGARPPWQLAPVPWHTQCAAVRNVLQPISTPEHHDTAFDTSTPASSAPAAGKATDAVPPTTLACTAGAVARAAVSMPVGSVTDARAGARVVRRRRRKVGA